MKRPSDGTKSSLRELVMGRLVAVRVHVEAEQLLGLPQTECHVLEVQPTALQRKWYPIYVCFIVSTLYMFIKVGNK